MRQLTCLAGACLCAATLAPTAALPQDAMWLGTGASFNSAGSWTPAIVPQRIAATFGQAQQTSVFIESAFTAGQTSVGAFIFTPDAPAYTFNPGISFLFHIPSQLVFNGAGIINNSSNRPTIVNNFASTTFTNGSGAGNAILNISCFSSSFCGFMAFANTSTASNSTISNTSLPRLQRFRDRRQRNHRHRRHGTDALRRHRQRRRRNHHHQPAGRDTFRGRASAGNAIIANTGGVIAFRDSATAGNANIVSTGGRITFQNRSTAGNAIIAATSSAQISFADQAQGGQARVIVDGTSTVTFGSLLSVGSIEGAGRFVVDAPAQNEIFVGTNNLSTVVTGTITSSRPSATLNKTGSGTLTLLGTNTLTSLGLFGGTVATNRDAGLGSANGSLQFANGGTLQLLSSFDLSPARVITLVSGNGTIDTNGFNMTIAQAISGNSGLLKTGLGTLTLAGNSTFRGGTIVNGGSLVVNGSLASSMMVGGAGSLVVNGTVTSDVVNAGTTTVNGLIGGNVNNNAGSLLVNGTVANNVVNAGTTTVTGLIGGNVNNAGLLGGTVANNVVNAGTTTVTGLIGGNVSNAGLLGGTGAIGGNVTNTGTVAPGNSIGTLTVSGSYTFLQRHLAAEVTNAGQGDRLNVGGVANLNGGTVTVQPPAGIYAPRTTYTILNAAGGVNGTFASVNESYPFLQSSLSYDANNVYFNLQIGGFAAQALNPTQYAVGAVLDANAANASGDFATVLGTLATANAAQGQAVMTALSGNNYAGFATAMVQGAQLFMNNFANQTGGGGSPVSNRVALAEACDVACDTASPPLWGAWGGALGGLGTIGATSRSAPSPIMSVASPLASTG
jgi:autotransporter-associated beta strand protein